jgi:hypothetical protein
MYQIDLATATADEVITRSIVCHPSTLIDTLRAAARIHHIAAVEATFGQMIALFGAACKLQLIPLKTGMDIIGRTTTKAAA